MMRRPLTTLVVVASCGVLVLGAGLAVAIEAGGGARAKSVAAEPLSRSWPVRMSAAPDDLTLAEVVFREPTRGQRIAGSSLHAGVEAPFGDDYVAAAVLRLPAQGASRVLVVLVNRPSPLLDPGSVTVRLTAPRVLAAPLVLKSADLLSRSAVTRKPALCAPALHGSALDVAQVRMLRTRGRMLAGFSAASVVAQAYDLVCGLPHDSSFAQAIEGPTAAPSPAPPEISPPTPTPPPPVGKVPGEGCVPTPGYACPASSRGGPRAPVAAGWGRTATGAH